MVLPLIWAPSALLLGVSMVPTVVTPEPEPPATSPITRHKLAVASYIRVSDEPAGIEMLPPVPVVIRLAAKLFESLLVMTAVWEAAFSSVKM